MSGQIAVLTGGAGFIARHTVVPLLGRGDRVRVLNNQAGGRIEK